MLPYQEGGKGRSLDQFILRDKSGTITRRPHHATGREDRLVSRPQIRPSEGLKPKFSARAQIADELEAAELPQSQQREILVIDFTVGVDELVSREDTDQYIPVFEESIRGSRINWIKKTMGRGKDSARNFVKDIKVGIDIPQLKVRRFSRA